MLPRSFLFALLILFTTAAHSFADHVQLEILPSVSAIQPGQPFRLGVKLSIDPGRHVYWKNPGDSGLPTRVTFALPDGFTADPVEFPAPSRFVLPGNITIFGYENSVMLIATIHPPANLATDFHGDFQADVRWLVCSDVCIPGKAGAKLSLGTASQPSPVNQNVFEDCISQIPVKPAENPEVAGVDTSQANSIVITWNHSAPQSADFFPDVTEDYNFTNIQVKSSQNMTTIGFTAQPLAGKKPAPATMQAVVAYTDKDGKRHGLIIPVALPGQAGNNK